MRTATEWVKQLLNSMKRYFRRYEFSIDHICDGYCDYDAKLFEKEKPYLEKILKGLKKRNILPRVGDQIYGYDNVFYVKGICFFRKMTYVYVDDEQNRIIE